MPLNLKSDMGQQSKIEILRATKETALNNVTSIINLKANDELKPALNSFFDSNDF